MAKKQDKQCGACPVRKTSIGGQALMEGIMMRGPKLTAMAVRNPKGEIVVETEPTVKKKLPAITRVPIIRGVVGFITSMTAGYKYLMRSAEISGLEELEAEMEREKAEKKAAKKAARAAKKNGGAAVVTEETPAVEEATAVAETTVVEEALAGEDVPVAEDAPAVEEATAAEEAAVAAEHAETVKTEKKKEKKSPMMTIIMVISVVFAVVLMVGLFILLPTFLYGLVEKIPNFPQDNRYLQSIFEGVLRVALLLGYMASVSLMKDIRRTFQYHGAEHKTIFCYEAGLELTVENVRMQKRFHPRCGTSFLILMMLVSIFVGFFIPPTLYIGVRVGIKVLLIPAVMGIGYELIKLCGKYDNWLTRIIAAPGKAFQRITVFEPDDSMIECAIAAMKEVIPDDDSDKI
jgi:uncharacterized protein YqhQ